MAHAELIASSVLPLLVAFFNLLIASHSLSGVKKDRALLGFGLATLGVGLWGIAWLIAVFDPSLVGALQFAGSAGGVIAMCGVAVHAIRGAEAGTRNATLIVAAALTSAALIALAILDPPAEGTRIGGAIGRAIGLGLLGGSATGFAIRAKKGPDQLHAKRALWIIALCVLAYGAIGFAAMFDDRTGVDPLLLLVLVAESTALLAIMERRVEMHILLSRAVTYAVLSMIAGGGGAVLLREVFGWELDLRHLALTIGIALSAALLFLGLGELMSRGVARLLFPASARLAEALTVSRSEAASLKRRLEHVERLAIAGEMAASVAHEIKNPLSPIRGYAQLLHGKLDKVEPAERELFEKAFKIITEESDRIDRRVAELLQLAKGDRVVEDGGSFELNQVLIEAIAVAEGEPSVEKIVQRLDPQIGAVNGSADELRGALVNVLKNAAEAMSEKRGVIEVETRREGEKRVVIEVRDEGVGLSEESADRAFDAFFSTKRGGTGLGLAIARSAIEAAGGTIRLQPRADKRGAVARIELER